MGVKQQGSESTSDKNTSLISRMASGLLSAISGLHFISHFPSSPNDQTNDHSRAKVELSPEAPITIHSDAEAFESCSGNHFENAPTNSITSASPTPQTQTQTQTQTSSTLSALFRADSELPQLSYHCQCQCQSHLSNPVAQAFKELEIGKAFLSFILPAATFLLAVHNKDTSPGLFNPTLCLLCIALVSLFYGIAFRNVFPEIGNALEQFGTACIYASFFMVV
ncbi:hypothetical protein LOK49_LG11G00796 [Camellia lanceoleosa]|uniref:Uncharacterized protein n=1 Tax=Camellia lanceoleosa TaxID=1840588 RepID=A0ACC0G6D6_9ERIC|nr:hypothetical protein LOK49_LG11G00796 [Camellia lanceoleosa]